MFPVVGVVFCCTAGKNFKRGKQMTCAWLNNVLARMTEGRNCHNVTKWIPPLSLSPSSPSSSSPSHSEFQHLSQIDTSIKPVDKCFLMALHHSLIVLFSLSPRVSSPVLVQSPTNFLISFLISSVFIFFFLHFSQSGWICGGAMRTQQTTEQ